MTDNSKSNTLLKILPYVILALFLISKPFQTKTDAIYYSAVYYWSLAIYFVGTKQFRFSDLWDNWKKGKQFWLPVLITIAGMIAAFAIGMLPEQIWDIDSGMGVYRIESTMPLLLFAVTLIPLPALAEESFFRKHIISFRSRTATVVTASIGLLLFGLTHSFNPVGVVIAMIWGVPWLVAYIKTKNVYVPVTAHFIGNLIMNGMIVANVVAALIK